MTGGRRSRFAVLAPLLALAALACGDTGAPLALDERGPPAPDVSVNPVPAPLHFDYVKVETGGGTSQWTGSVTGDITGTLNTQASLVRVAGPIWHLSTIWQVTKSPYDFDATLVGTLDTRSGALKLNGYVTSGSFAGARIHNVGQVTAVDPVTGATTFTGHAILMPGSAY